MANKTKIYKWSLVIGLIGIVIIIASVIRWFFLYPDYSQLTIAVGVGVIFYGFAYVYNVLKVMDKQMGKFEDNEEEQDLKFDKALDALNIYYHDKIEKIEAKIGNGK